jgi:hypothetical protein
MTHFGITIAERVVFELSQNVGLILPGPLQPLKMSRDSDDEYRYHYCEAARVTPSAETFLRYTGG